ncbi:hypothetical protein [Citrobacter koseri]|uniref:hypothetical protein n=1 Tax=Citrobacter koseri TaxID=545 RepID=UPI000E07DF3B|nr:hypothetical protein [Citrobacter koseri]STB73262.1 Uncharacterised protein [Citrobacter koseri]STT23443.1 Uncharacterised protein [Citrobacter koseri]
MTSDNLTDNRITEILVRAEVCDDTVLTDYADIAAAMRELQQRRAADKNFFMYGIAEPDGSAYMDEVCVSHDRGLLETIAGELNLSEGSDGYRVVALYTVLPLNCHEREELLTSRNELEAAKKRIAEFGARSISLTMPPRKSKNDYVEETFDNFDLAAIYNACRLECEVTFRNACSAAGIRLEVE